MEVSDVLSRANSAWKGTSRGLTAPPLVQFSTSRRHSPLDGFDLGSVREEAGWTWSGTRATLCCSPGILTQSCLTSSPSEFSSDRSDENHFLPCSRKCMHFLFLNYRRLGVKLGCASVYHKTNRETVVEINDSVRAKDVFILQSGNKSVQHFVYYWIKTSIVKGLIVFSWKRHI